MPHSKPESKLIKAAGAVAWRPGPDGEPEILLVHRRKYDDWSLPKGKVEPGEPFPVTAVREVLEESGARLALGRRLASVKYNVGGRPKRVHYWAARVTSTDGRAIPNSEVDEVAWVPAPDAAGRVSYPHDRRVLADFARLPAVTVPLILLRHAKAQSKSSWKRGDASRPLDDSGQADAKMLAELLSCFAPGARLVSSPATRCVDTLRPFAAQSGARVHEEPALAIRPSGTDAADYARIVADAIVAGVPTVICAHRENLPALQEAALAALGAGPSGTDDPGAEAPGADDPAGGVRPADLPREWADTLPTAGFWVLNVAPLPAPPAADPPVTDPPAADPPAAYSAGSPAGAAGAPRPRKAAAALRFLARWLRGQAGVRLDPDAAGSAAAAGASGVDGATDGASTAEAAGPAGLLLVSADRYDLSGA